MKIFLFFLFSIYYFVQGQSESKDKWFRIRLKEQKSSFTLPQNYSEHNGGFTYECRDSRNANGIKYSIINKDSSILIAYSVNRDPDKKDLLKIKQWSASYNPDSNYVYAMRSLADTVNSKITYHAKSAKKANAEVCASFSRNCRIPVLGKYENNRFYIFAKKGRGYFEIIYFYTDKAKNEIQKEIDRTIASLKFEKVKTESND